MKKVLLSFMFMIVLASCSNDNQETPTNQASNEIQRIEGKTFDPNEITKIDQPEPKSNLTSKHYPGYRGAALYSGSVLYEGNYLESSNTKYNFKVGWGSWTIARVTINTAALIWNTQKLYNGVGYTIMQSDGNLVVYANGRAVAATFTNGNPGAYLVMQDDGNLVIYTRNGRPIWATGTNGR